MEGEKMETWREEDERSEVIDTSLFMDDMPSGSSAELTPKSSDRLIPLRTGDEIKRFMKTILLQFVAIVDISASELVDKLVAVRVLNDRDIESLNGKHVPTKNEQARKLWTILYHINAKTFVKQVLPLLVECYWYIIPEQFWLPGDAEPGQGASSHCGAAGREEAGHSVCCVRHVIQGRIRPTDLGDFLLTAGLITSKTHENISSSYRRSSTDWSKIFGAFEKLAGHDVSSHVILMRKLMVRYSLLPPDNLPELLIRGFPSCSSSGKKPGHCLATNLSSVPSSSECSLTSVRSVPVSDCSQYASSFSLLSDSSHNDSASCDSQQGSDCSLTALKQIVSVTAGNEPVNQGICRETNNEAFWGRDEETRVKETGPGLNVEGTLSSHTSPDEDELRVSLFAEEAENTGILRMSNDERFGQTMEGHSTEEVINQSVRISIPEETSRDAEALKALPEHSISHETDADNNNSTAGAHNEAAEIEPMLYLAENVGNKDIQTSQLESGIRHGCCQLGSVVKGLLKLAVLGLLLYVIFCCLDLLESSFYYFGAELLYRKRQGNPIEGLIVGTWITFFSQSSSTSLSLVITLVSFGIMEVRHAIPIVVGVNIGTFLFSIMIVFPFIKFRDSKWIGRAVSGATVHDIVNLLTATLLLPVECLTGYLYYLTQKIVQGFNLEELQIPIHDLHQQLTQPLTKYMVQALCVFNNTESERTGNKTLVDGNITLVDYLVLKTPLEKCDGNVSFSILTQYSSFVVLMVCLYLMTTVLLSLLGSQQTRNVKKILNANFPGPFACLTDYFAIIVGAVMCFLLQSSVVFNIMLLTLVAMGCLDLERMYPLILGSNFGATGIGILTALASPFSTKQPALQLVLCHLFFNISGILLFFPLSCARRFPLRIARSLGRTSSKYRWFVFFLCMVYLVCQFCLNMLSSSGYTAITAVLSTVGVLVAAVIVLNVMQRSDRLRGCLPPVLHDWEWLPLPLRSLRPLDQLFGHCCLLRYQPQGEDGKPDVASVECSPPNLQPLFYDQPSYQHGRQ